MQNSKIYQSPCLNSHAFSFDSINVLTRQKHTLASPCRPVITQDSQKKYLAIQTSFSSSPQGKSQDKTTLADGTHQAKHHISMRSLEEPFQRAVFVMFIIGEIHPFLDGNGRISRIMMNGELLKANEYPIIIPIIYRNNYLSSLKALSHHGMSEPLIRTAEQRLQTGAKS
jgi:hypothetical protein